MSSELNFHVARLDGYLRGITELSGTIRGHLGAAYLLARDDPDKSLAVLVSERYHQHLEIEDGTELPEELVGFEEELKRLARTEGRELAGRMRDLEHALCDHLAVDVMDGALGASGEAISGRKRYLAFRVMDMLDPIEDALGQCHSVVRLERDSTHRRAHTGCRTHCVYFGLMYDSACLVLQFNTMTYGAWVGEEHP